MRFLKILLLGMLCWNAGALAQQATQTPTLPPPPITPGPAKPSAGTPQTAVQSPAAASGRTLDKTDLDTWLDGYMPFALNTSDIPGAVIVVVKDGQVLSARGFGYADVDKRTPVDGERTLFRPGSVSKLVTWTAVMQMVEQGKIDLDADVNTYLDFKIPERAGKPVTMREIMTHTAGFEESVKYLIVYDKNNARPLGELLKAWVPDRIFNAGTTPAYSNYATSLAGYIVERVSGMPFNDYVEKQIFAPLNMRTATFRQPLPAALEPLMAKGYSKPGEPSLGFEIVNSAPAGALSASGQDMANFMLAHLAGGQFNGQRILSAATAKTMHDSPLDKIGKSTLLPPLNRMELGFFETNVNGRDVIAHLGDTEGFHSSLHLYMDDGVGLYLSVNSGGRAGASNTLRSAVFQDFSDRYFPTTLPADGRVPEAEAKRHAEMMTGSWESTRRSESNFFALFSLLGQVKVTLDDKGNLVVPALLGPNGRPREWVEIAPFVWRDKNGEDRLAAQLENGQVVRWSMDFMSPFMVFDRVPAGKDGAWLIPAACVAAAVLLFAVLAMPGGWIVRRRYKLQHTLDKPARQAALATRLSALAILAVLAGWGGVVTAFESTLENATSPLDPWLWLLQIGGLFAFVAALVAGARNLQLAFKEPGRLRKFWSVLYLLSALLLAYVALRGGLLSMTVNY
ncbi:serine hydrolase domain-containing protein [Massilia sp. CFBP9026]|uniref:serine hydrolase domain-containing protein n=1 Tax=Massilia sp. CFBP9026 TaxID=3096536 RepID=UPI002A69989A|nr:serine hydrolase domain-containing protein [Massilia sp. CFBP9026]MDY0962613.1 serine hydrolase domain-containing protein [Massilia sp. CFBP9026]